MSAGAILEQQPPSEALSALRSQGLDRQRPVRFHYLLALANRLDAQPEPVRRVLRQRLDAAVAHELAAAEATRDAAKRSVQQAAASAAPPLAPEPAPAPAPAPSPEPSALQALVQLNRELGIPRPATAVTASGVTSDDLAPDDSAAGDPDAQAPRDLRSVSRFSTTLARIAAERKVAQAMARGPQNAGPLNAHRLMVRALAAMQAQSPDYLQRFLVQAETLLWMEQAHQQARRARPSARVRAAQTGR